MSGTTVREVEKQLREVMASFDVALLSVTDAQDLLGSFSAIKRMAEGGELACTKRVADSSVARTRGDRDGRKWAGRRMGVSDGQAGSFLQLAEQLEQLPDTRQALHTGRISKEQAAEIARTAAEVPSAEQTMLEAAPRESLGELKRRGRRARASAPGAEERRQRERNRRELKMWTDDDGRGRGSWDMSAERQTELLALIQPFRERLFTEARREGRREPAEAYDADALLAMARAAHGHLPEWATRAGSGSAPVAAGSTSGAERRRGAERRTPLTGQMKVIVRVDGAELARGEVADGELCEVVGVGAVPVEAVRDWIADDAFVAAVLTQDTDVSSVVHLGRSPTALQRTVLEWEQPECQVLGCSAQARLEIDHTDDWADTHLTTLSKLDRLCTHHHDMKTNDGYRLEPGRGKRRFLSPEEQRARPKDRVAGEAPAPDDEVDDDAQASEDHVGVVRAADDEARASEAGVDHASAPDDGQESLFGGFVPCRSHVERATVRVRSDGPDADPLAVPVPPARRSNESSAPAGLHRRSQRSSRAVACTWATPVFTRRVRPEPTAPPSCDADRPTAISVNAPPDSPGATAVALPVVGAGRSGPRTPSSAVDERSPPSG